MRYRQPRHEGSARQSLRGKTGPPVVSGPATNVENQRQALLIFSTNSWRMGANHGVSACHHHMLLNTSGR